jgi:hypothetical protein
LKKHKLLHALLVKKVIEIYLYEQEKPFYPLWRTMVKIMLQGITYRHPPLWQWDEGLWTKRHLLQKHAAAHSQFQRVWDNN